MEFCSSGVGFKRVSVFKCCHKLAFFVVVVLLYNDKEKNCDVLKTADH